RAVRACEGSPVCGGGRGALGAGGARRGPRAARGWSRPGERPCRDRRGRSVVRRREPQPRDLSRDQGSRPRARLRGGGQVTSVDAGYFGPYGGRYVPETLVPALDELERGWQEIKDDPGFALELEGLQRDYVGRPTPLYRTERLADGKSVYLKREDLCHTGAHKINNALGQAL